MSILSTWFRKSSTQVVLKAAVDIIKVILGKGGEELWLIVQKEVVAAKDLQLSGPDKAKWVFNQVKADFPELKSYILNLMMELAVTHLKEGMIKR